MTTRTSTFFFYGFISLRGGYCISRDCGDRLLSEYALHDVGRFERAFDVVVIDGGGDFKRDPDLPAVQRKRLYDEIGIEYARIFFMRQ